MFCNQCGKQIEDNAIFCPNCGAKQDPLVKSAAAAALGTAPVPANAAVQGVVPANADIPAATAMPSAAAIPVQTAAPGAVPAQKVKKANKGFPFKIVVPLAGIVVLAVVLLVVILSLTGGGIKADKYTYNDMVGYLWGSSGPSFFNMQGDNYEVEDVSYYGFNPVESADISVIAYTVWNEKSDDYDLYYMTKDLEPVLVEEDVHYSIKISYDGAYIAYLTDVKDDTSGDLYLYSIKDDKSTLIDSEVYPYLICMSPGGKAVAYLREFEDSNDNELYVGGIKIDSKKVDKDGAIPVAIRDSGKEMYYVTDNNKLYLYNGKDSVKLASDVDRDFYFNRDASQMLYMKGGKTYYYELKTEEPVKVASAEIYDIALPIDVLSYEGNNFNTSFVGLASLKGCVLETDSGLYWLNDKGTDTVRIANTYTYQLSADGKSILYQQNGKSIYKISKFGEDMDPKVVYNDEFIDYFVASADLSKVYVAIDDELHYVKGEKKTERITNDLSDGYSVVVYNNSMGKIFFIERDTLCCAGTTAKSKTEVAEDVDEVVWVPGGIAYTIIEDDEIIFYYMQDKEATRLYSY